jgi:sterol desaturase/sphingolipid hydroxylase (fatty acid hydroxylase superfamily)
MAMAERLLLTQSVGGVLVLTILWLLEAWLPFLGGRPSRLRHDLQNLAIGGLNLIVLALGFSWVTAAVAGWALEARFGLLHVVTAPSWAEAMAAVLLLDAWMYFWHRANHAVPLLWRFHQTHHRDTELDVTTALRFHVGEITISAVLRLLVIPLLGLELWQVILYETVLLPVIAFHHSNIALPGAWDRWLRALIVSPNMHRVHHSDWQPETDSNFASVFSWWDRIGGTYRRRERVREIRFGLRTTDQRPRGRRTDTTNDQQGSLPTIPAPRSIAFLTTEVGEVGSRSEDAAPSPARSSRVPASSRRRRRRSPGGSVPAPARGSRPSPGERR